MLMGTFRAKLQHASIMGKSVRSWYDGSSTTHSTHFFYKLYGVGYMVKDHSDSKGENHYIGLLLQKYCLF